MRNRILSAAAAWLSIVVLAAAVEAGTVTPTSYSMINGGSSSKGYTYHDESYTGSGNNAANYASLSGGLGDLTDGTISMVHFDAVEWANANGPYVAWWGKDPTITFGFSGVVKIDTVTVWADDYDGTWGAKLPSSIDIKMGGKNLSYAVTNPSGSAVRALTFSGLNLSGSSLQLTLNQGSNWIFISEVEFKGPATVVPLPATAWLGLGLLGGLGLVRRVRRRKRA